MKSPNPKPAHTPEWYEGKTGNHQGLIIEEGTGKTIAVVYDKADAPTIVKSVNCHREFYDALEIIASYENVVTSGVQKHMCAVAKAAIRKAEQYK